MVTAGNLFLVAHREVRQTVTTSVPIRFGTQLSMTPPRLPSVSPRAQPLPSDHLATGIQNTVIRSGASSTPKITGDPGKPVPHAAGSIKGTEKHQMGVPVRVTVA